ncbi:MAG: sulfite exporter TauE/SafE family protein [Bilophila sp.]
MYFPTAGIEVSPLIPPLASFAVSFFMSMGGLSGAFLLVPFQMSVLGYTNTSVSATSQLYNVFSNPGGVFRYWREERMVWPLAWVILLGTIPGILIGALVRVYWLPDARPFKLFVALVLFCIGVQLLRDLRRVRSGVAVPAPRPVVRIVEQNHHRVRYQYDGREYTFSVPVLLLFCVGVGVVGGIYGIGGGALIAPFLVSVFGLPIHTVAGATLCATCLAAGVGVGFYTLLAPFFPHLTLLPDWRMALLLGMGGLCGMYLGARCQKYVPARALKWMLVLVLLGTVLAYGIEFFTVRP